MKQYNDGNEKKYLSKNPLKRYMIKRFLLLLVKVFEGFNKEDLTVLDVGTGEGFSVNYLYDNLPKADITAVDYFEEALMKAKKNNERKIKFQQGDIYNLNFDDESFDVAMATEVLEHLEKPEQALRELLRVSQKYVVISVPREPWFCLGNFLSGKNVSRFGNPVDHINHWSKGKFEDFVRQIIPCSCQVKTYSLFVWTMAVIKK